jgi:hypothetical protein
MAVRVEHDVDWRGQTCTCRALLNATLVPGEDRLRCSTCGQPIRHTGSAAIHLRWLQLAVLLVGATEQDADDTASDTTQEMTGTMAPSHAMPQGQAFPTPLYELSEPWWKTPMRLWPAFRKLSPEEYKALFPPCWGTIHDGRYWVDCDLCRAEFKRQNGGRGSLPSVWICRCGNHDLLWHHKARPHHDEHCRPCMEAMRADGIDYEMWRARCKRERDQLISEQLAAAADKWLMKDATIFTHSL